MRLLLGAVYYCATLPAIMILVAIDYVAQSLGLRNNLISRWLDAAEREALVVSANGPKAIDADH